ncbi:hypothetical protein ACOME3_004063 [Neoechinorhynchus agilis]
MSYDSTRSKWTKNLVTSSILATASASFMYGFGIGAPCRDIRLIDPFLSSTGTYKKYGNIFLHNVVKDARYTVFVVGAFFGAMAISFLYRFTKFFNRKRAFYLTNVLSVVSAVMIVMSQYLKCVALFYSARFLHGIQGGLSSCIVPPYLHEISPKVLRGKIGCLHHVFIATGIAAAQIIDSPFILGRKETWSVGMALGSLTSILAIFLTPKYMIDSPCEAVIIDKDESKARRCLKKLRLSDEVDVEIRELEDERLHDECTMRTSILQLIRCKNVRWQLATALVMISSQTLCGISVIISYSTKLRDALKVERWFWISALILTLTGVTAASFAILLIERFGRRRLLLDSMYALCTFSFFLGLLIFVNNTTKIAAFDWIALCCVFASIVCFNIGLGPVPNIYTCETFRFHKRDAVLSLCHCVSYILKIFDRLLFPIMDFAIKNFIFLILISFQIATLTFLYFKMIETNGKSIEEIEDELKNDKEVYDDSLEADFAIQSIFSIELQDF